MRVGIKVCQKVISGRGEGLLSDRRRGSGQSPTPPPPGGVTQPKVGYQL